MAPNPLDQEQNNGSFFYEPSQFKQPFHRPSLLERIGSQARLLWGPRSLLLGLAIASLSTGGGKYLMSQVQNQKTQKEAVTNSNISAEQSQLQRVTLHTAKLSTIQETLSLTGTVVPRELIRVAPSVSGLQILEMRLAAGDRVQPGQVIAILDNTLLRSAIAQAEAGLAQAQAELQRQKANLNQAQMLQKAAGADIARYGTLHQAGAISQEQLGQKEIEAATAQSGVSVAAASFSSARANVASKLAEIVRIQAQLDQTVITAPVGGIVAHKLTTVGNTASAGSPLYSIIAGEQLDLVLRPSQAQLKNIEIGSPVLVSTTVSTTPKSTNTRYSVYAIEPTLNADSRQAAVKVSLDPSTASIRPGMFLQADIVVDQRRSVVVPASAVVTQSDGSTVIYTLSDRAQDSKTVEANVVEVSNHAANNASEAIASNLNISKTVEVRSGLSAGSRVIVEGASYLKAGDKVRVMPTSSSAFKE